MTANTSAKALKSQRRETSRQSSPHRSGSRLRRLPPTNKLVRRTHTLTPSPSEGTHHPAAESGPSPVEGEEAVLSAEPGLASSKTRRPLKTHSCSYLTQRLNTAQQLRSPKLREQLNCSGSGCRGLILCGGAAGLRYYLNHRK